MRVRVDRVRFTAELVKRDMTVKSLAELTGVSRATLTSVKSGKSCSQETADKLTAVLGRDIIREEA